VRFLKAEDRVIFLDHSTDSAIVLFVKGELQLPEGSIALIPVGEPCGIGADIGWLGFPNLEPETMCFFSGTKRLASAQEVLLDRRRRH
jgi:hypothetical protein